MIYNWDIDTWGTNEVPVEIRTPKQVSWVKVLLSPLKRLYQDFMAFRTATIQEINGSSETLVLQNILNDEFDAVLRQIYISTVFNSRSPTYIATVPENDPLYVATTAENSPVYIGMYSEYGLPYDFLVEARAGSLTTEQIVRLKSIVNRYRFLGTRPYYRYLVTQEPF